MRHAWWVACALTVVGCGRKATIEGAWVGTATEVGRVQVDTGPGDGPGRVNVRWWDTNRPRGGVRVTVTPAGERRYRIALPGCLVEAEMSPEPNDHSGQLALSPQPVCEIDIDHYRGPMPVSGSVTLDRATRTLRVSLSGANNQPSPNVRWTMNYEARPQ